MSAVFADTVYFIDLLNRDDRYHQRAASAAQNLRQDIITTDWILLEVANSFAKTDHRVRIPAFIRQLRQDPKTRIISAQAELFERGLELYDARPDKK